jgi:hypothetical protein
LKAKRIYLAILIGFIILTQGACGKLAKTEAPKYVEIAKHVTKEVFNKTNIYNAYPVNSPEYKKPFSVDFSLAEISQKKDSDTVKVEMIYSVIVTDYNRKTVGGSRDVTITFTVHMVDGGWIITNKEER